MKLKTAIRRFETQLIADGKSDHTRTAYLRDIGLFMGWLADKDISKIKPDVIARFFVSDNVKLSSNGKARAAISVNRIKTSIRTFFNYLVEAGYLKQSPARLIKAAKTSRKVPETLVDDDAKQLLDTIKQSKSELAKRDHAIISLLLATGIRLSSLCNLNSGDVMIKKGIIKITAKGGREETVFISPKLKQVLRKYLADSTSNDAPLFQSRHGRRLCRRQIQMRVAMWLKASGINKGSVHTLRHTFATKLYDRTRDLYLVQKALGHQQITSTEIYTKVSNRSLQKAINLL
ncbi:MAG: tyrosine-type recombinase/integrase [candidate division Zixibacteria bacterium]|nr:tyrosine-type recombinase/integrase [candidate division Zixibacteria bacterium]